MSFATKYSQIVLLNYRLVRTFKCHYASRFQQVSVEVEKYLDKNLISQGILHSFNMIDVYTAFQEVIINLIKY